ncbi:hypothetical protein NSK_005108 [Nannochloropsis salina CCMP1776]|uniref:Uncharacterized protein n=1 Tax=Nannochloropsis salina CCMP1776 TaxID=1027361 RepID=A0A4D9D1Y1_9STRA|nr:hypothetical protein NSK_005108 [Nannochloropsis salina CCMP1776]|eukprot:TFJ84013.1 hypothetical protein NSK_005108 [Nannochloropsis salina CCMP1776]
MRYETRRAGVNTEEKCKGPTVLLRKDEGSLERGEGSAEKRQDNQTALGPGDEKGMKQKNQKDEGDTGREQGSEMEIETEEEGRSLGDGDEEGMDEVVYADRSVRAFGQTRRGRVSTELGSVKAGGKKRRRDEARGSEEQDGTAAGGPQLGTENGQGRSRSDREDATEEKAATRTQSMLSTMPVKSQAIGRRFRRRALGVEVRVEEGWEGGREEEEVGREGWGEAMEVEGEMRKGREEEEEEEREEEMPLLGRGAGDEEGGGEGRREGEGREKEEVEGGEAVRRRGGRNRLLHRRKLRGAEGMREGGGRISESAPVEKGGKGMTRSLGRGRGGAVASHPGREGGREGGGMATSREGREGRGGGKVAAKVRTQMAATRWAPRPSLAAPPPSPPTSAPSSVARRGGRQGISCAWDRPSHWGRGRGRAGGRAGGRGRRGTWWG